MGLKSYTSDSPTDNEVKHLNGNIHYQTFYGIMIDLSYLIMRRNYKIVCAIRNEISSRLNIESLQKVCFTPTYLSALL